MKRRNVIRIGVKQRRKKKKGDVTEHILYVWHMRMRTKNTTTKQKRAIEALTVCCLKWQLTYAYFANAKQSNNSNSAAATTRKSEPTEMLNILEMLRQDYFYTTQQRKRKKATADKSKAKPKGNEGRAGYRGRAEHRKRAQIVSENCDSGNTIGEQNVYAFIGNAHRQVDERTLDADTAISICGGREVVQ